MMGASWWVEKSKEKKSKTTPSDVTVTEGSSLNFWSSWPMTETVEN
jgi:hypothetical protein